MQIQPLVQVQSLASVQPAAPVQLRVPQARMALQRTVTRRKTPCVEEVTVVDGASLAVVVRTEEESDSDSDDSDDEQPAPSKANSAPAVPFAPVAGQPAPPSAAASTMSITVSTSE